MSTVTIAITIPEVPSAVHRDSLAGLEPRGQWVLVFPTISTGTSRQHSEGDHSTLGRPARVKRWASVQKPASLPSHWTGRAVPNLHRHFFSYDFCPNRYASLEAAAGETGDHECSHLWRRCASPAAGRPGLFAWAALAGVSWAWKCPGAPAQRR